MITQSSLSHTIARALESIVAAQLPNGGFPSQTSIYQEGRLTQSEYRETVFYPAIISLALGQVNQTNAPTSQIIQKIQEKISRFLEGEMWPEFFFTYWTRATADLPNYPPDLDDTMLAVSALQQYDPQFLSGTRLAQLTTHLLTCETVPGGPYRTWITTHRQPGPWQDIDVVVNANICHTLKQSHITLPALEKFCTEAIQNRRFYSPYYVGVWPAIYALTKLNLTDQKIISSLINYTQAHLKSLYDPLACALVASALVRLHAPRHMIEPLIHNLVQTSTPFPASAYVMERHRAQQTELSGASTWTAAATVEALSLYQKYSEPPTALNVPTHFKIELYDTIVLKTTYRFNSLPAPLHEVALSALAHIIAGDRQHEIALLASYTNQYLGQPVQRRTLQRLGFVNLLGWLAYALYDECFDEHTISSRLAVANLALREVGASYQLLTSNNRCLQQWTKQILDRVDGAHGLELEYGRLPLQSGQVDLNKLSEAHQLPNPSERSLAHSLSAGYIFEATKPTNTRELLHRVEMFFRDYLATKQICDDMHDWYDDLLRGHLTSVTLPLWQEWRMHTDIKITSIHLLEATPTLQSLFWKKIFPNTISRAEKYLADAKTACADLPWHTTPTYFHDALTRLDTSLVTCRQEYEKTQTFLESYAQHYRHAQRVTASYTTKAQRRNYLRHAAAMVAHQFKPPTGTRTALGESYAVESIR